MESAPIFCPSDLMEVDLNLKILHIIRHKWALSVWIWHCWHAASHHSQSVCLLLRVVDRLPLLLLLLPSPPLLPKVVLTLSVSVPSFGNTVVPAGELRGADSSVLLNPSHGFAAGQLQQCRSLLLPGPPPGQEEEEETVRAQRWILNRVGGGCFPGCSCLICWANWSVSWAACFDSSRLEKLLYRS